MRYLICASFDGTEFFGSSPQPGKRTVTNVIEENISKILNTPTKITACSRLDRGVHANKYYFHFDTEKTINTEIFLNSLNKLTEDDIYFLNIKKVKDNFHARFNVKNKEYLYLINTGIFEPTKRNVELQYNKDVDIDLLTNASSHLLGTHDFKTFTSDNEKENYIRTIYYIKIKKQKNLIKVYINADGFLKYMVRNIIGMFLEINEGKIKIESIDKIIQSKDRKQIGRKASACGLYLNKVNFKSKSS